MSKFWNKRLSGDLLGKRLMRVALSLAVSITMTCSSLPMLAAEVTTTPQIIEYALPSGQMLYIKPDHDQPIVTIDTWVKTGSVNETTQINGVSHFLEHLLFKGTTKYKPGEIERILESKGAEFNAATSDDFTHYYITTATPYFEEALKLHADMLLNATLPQNELTRERLVVQEEINRATDNPQRKMYIELARLMYGNHGYGLDTLGPKENIANIPRSDILDYYHYWYQPKNFSTVIVGDINPDDVKALVAKYFQAPGYKKPDGYTPPSVGIPLELSSAKSSVIADPNIAQAYFTLNFPGPSIQKPHDTYALDIAMNVLGSGKSSRLYSELVEKQPLALSVSASNMTQKYTGLLNIDAQTTPANLDTVKQKIIQAVQELKAHGITAEELAKAKTQYLKNFIFLNETTDGVAQSVGYNVTIGSLENYTDYVSEIQKITQDDVLKAVREYIDFDRAVLLERVPQQSGIDTAAREKQNLALLQSADTGRLSLAHAPGAATTSENTLSPQTASASRQTTQLPAESAVSASQATTQPEQHENQIEKLTLPNGMRAILKANPDSETVAIKLFVQGGQATEPVPGVAALTSQLLTQGTRERTAEMISRELESRGMNLTVSASDDYLEIAGDAVKTDVGELFMILHDVLSNSTFSESELAKQKELLRQSIIAGRDNPSAVAFENLQLTLYPQHPYGNVGKRIEQHLPIIGRDQIVRYVKSNIVPQNMLAVVVGNFDPQTMKNYLGTLLPQASQSQVVQAKPVESVRELAPPVPPLQKSLTVEDSKAKQAATWIAKGWLAPEVDSKDYVPLKVLNSLLGTGMSSRLFVNLRERQGLAYVVSSFYPSRAETSRFVLYIGTDPKNSKQVAQGFEREIERLKREPVPPTELQDAKDKLAGSFALAHETNASQAYYLGLFEILGVGYQYDMAYPKLIQEVSVSDVQRVARKYFSQPSVTSIVQPQARPNESFKAKPKPQSGANQPEVKTSGKKTT